MTINCSRDHHRVHRLESDIASRQPHPRPQSVPLDGAISIRTATLDSVRIDAGRIVGCKLTQSALLATVKVDVFEVEGVDVTWEISEDGETDVDDEIGTASRDHEYSDGREEDGDEDDEEGGRCVGHCALFALSFWSAVSI